MIINIRKDVSKFSETMEQKGGKMIISIRKDVSKFSETMEQVLRQNDHKKHYDGCSLKYKKHYDGCSLKYLKRRLYEEFAEWVENGDPKELVDVANFCMMIVKKETHFNRDCFE